MTDTALIQTGIIGALFAAICCATPILVIALGAVGLSALTGYLDYVLFPLLAVSLAVLGYGLHLRRQRLASCCDTTVGNETTPRT